ncbi:hypothetical protein VM1G_11960 [Cytospora mali]|uniref:Uncharacterized protein n=1 Tax=Cytospora mali TaxID=578113 RepID=A0A194WD59_CYTMA|nr:hypothetical protein VM1G_11960 [Valsa mali]
MSLQFLSIAPVPLVQDELRDSRNSLIRRRPGGTEMCLEHVDSRALPCHRGGVVYDIWSSVVKKASGSVDGDLCQQWTVETKGDVVLHKFGILPRRRDGQVCLIRHRSR